MTSSGGAQRAAAQKPLAEQELRTLATEVTDLRSSVTNLTSGVVKALQVLGLLEEGPDGLKHMARKGAAGNVPSDDSLQSSLAERVSQKWQTRKTSGPPGRPVGYMGALQSAIPLDEHEIAKPILGSPSSPSVASGPYHSEQGSTKAESIDAPLMPQPPRAVAA
eukprot:TRINITY_DN6400_c0_g1_i2.p1 TRINITY_DN6400_c0_g1~~TRINITY_DN6400_c0_g1_i2.p1  ORF type:complete len:164 (+),score=37.50 TRINITY_DN6400_c0_g1_i2:174-665(+)